MRHRLTIMGALFAAVLALTALPARASEKFIVFFQPWSAELDPAAEDVVAAAIAYAKQNAAMQIEIIGFASFNGGQKANLYLSLVRAQRISDQMATGGIAPGRLVRVGEGSVTAVGSAVHRRHTSINHLYKFKPVHPMFIHSGIGAEGNLYSGLVGFCKCGFDLRPYFQCFRSNKFRIITRFLCRIGNSSAGS